MAERLKWVRIVLALLFALLSLNALGQVWLNLVSRSEDPPALTVLQAVVGVTAALASVGAWRLRVWAPLAAVAHGVAACTMLVMLPGLLDLEPEARTGIWIGASSVLAFGLAAGWYLRRVLRNQAATT